MIARRPDSHRDVEPIFLVSLPRSGSTLLQRILGAHSAVSTTPEPWLLLPLLYALRSDGVYAEYGHRVAAMALEDLCRRLPGGVAAYRAEVRDLALSLYAQASTSDSRYFLDKTPRYMLVIDELLQMFPDARFICLWRNPLAIVASLSESWAGGRWQPYLHKVDLFAGLAELVDAVRQHPERFVVVRYEALVEAPAATCQDLLEQLDLRWEPNVLEDFTAVSQDGLVGDKWGAALYDQVSTEPVAKWQRSLSSPVRKLWCWRYLTWIGRDRLAVMGYSFDELMADLHDLEARWSGTPRDAVGSAKGVVYNLLEPQIIKSKVAAAAHGWSSVLNHT